LKIELANFREVAAFAQFGSDLDANTQFLLNRGTQLVELLKQKQFVPLSVDLQIVIMFAGSQGVLNSLELDEIQKFEAGLLDVLKEQFSFLQSLRESKLNLTDEELMGLYEASCYLLKRFI
jgi:F0F1-type ATP synthase alpha subunit